MASFVNKIALVLSLLVLGQVGVCSSDWRGFHGAEHRGNYLAASPPVIWSVGKCGWQVSESGRGYSSPVVADGTVYVTTAYERPKHTVAKKCADNAALILAALIAFTGAATIVGLVEANPQRPLRKLCNYVRSLVLAAFLALAVIVVFFGSEMLQLDQVAARSWKVGIALSAVSLVAIPFINLRPFPNMAVFLGASLATLCMVYFLRPEALATRAGVWIAGFAGLVSGVSILWITFVVLNRNLMQNATPILYTAGGTPAFWGGLASCGIPTVAIVGMMLLLAKRAAAQSNAPSELAINPASVVFLGGVTVMGVVTGVYAFRGHMRLRSVISSVSTLALAGLAISLSVRHGFASSKEFGWGLASIEAQSGKQNWERELASGVDSRELSRLGNSHASATPVVSGDRVYAFFGTKGLFCVSRTGKMLWRTEGFLFNGPFGDGPSPIAAENTVVLVNDLPRSQGSAAADRPHVVALDASTGKVRWQKERTSSKSGHGAYSTPLLFSHGGTSTVIVRGWEDITAYELQAGDIKWAYPIDYIGDHLVATLTTDTNRLFAVDSERIIALDYAALCKGQDAVAWSAQSPGETIATPVVADGLLFSVSESGVAVCVDVVDGKLLWEYDFHDRVFASIVSFGPFVVFIGESGTAWVVKRERSFTLVHKNSLGSRAYATPAVQKDRIFIRTETALYCFAEPERDFQ